MLKILSTIAGNTWVSPMNSILTSPIIKAMMKKNIQI
jgi:hypothetical protein